MVHLVHIPPRRTRWRLERFWVLCSFTKWSSKFLVFFSFWCRNLAEEKEEKGGNNTRKRGLGKIGGTWFCPLSFFFYVQIITFHFHFSHQRLFVLFRLSLSHTSENLWNANAQCIGYVEKNPSPYTRTKLLSATHKRTLSLKGFVWQHRVFTKVGLTGEACHARS